MLEHWRERAIRIDREGRMTTEDRLLLHSFRTCIVGEAREQYPELVKVVDTDIYEPTDPTLRALGIQAWESQRDGHRRPLSPFIDRIEDRVLELKREEMNETTP